MGIGTVWTPSNLLNPDVFSITRINLYEYFNTNIELFRLTLFVVQKLIQLDWLRQKVTKHFLTQKLGKYWKIKDSIFELFLEKNGLHKIKLKTVKLKRL